MRGSRPVETSARHIVSRFWKARGEKQTVLTLLETEVGGGQGERRHHNVSDQPSMKMVFIGSNLISICLIMPIDLTKWGSGAQRCSKQTTAGQAGGVINMSPQEINVSAQREAIHTMQSSCCRLFSMVADWRTSDKELWVCVWVDQWGGLYWQAGGPSRNAHHPLDSRE